MVLHSDPLETLWLCIKDCCKLAGLEASEVQREVITSGLEGSDPSSPHFNALMLQGCVYKCFHNMSLASIHARAKDAEYKKLVHRCMLSLDELTSLARKHNSNRSKQHTPSATSPRSPSGPMSPTSPAPSSPLPSDPRAAALAAALPAAGACSETSFSHFAPAVRNVASLLTVHTLFEALAAAGSVPHGVPYATWDAYISGLIKVQESCTAATGSLRLCHGFSEGEQVIAEANASLTLGSGRDKDLVGAGRLTLTQRAAYFLTDTSFFSTLESRALRFDLSSPVGNPQVSSLVVDPLAAFSLFSSSRSIALSSSQSPPWLLEFAEYGTERVRDKWAALVGEVIAVHDFVRQYQPVHRGRRRFGLRLRLRVEKERARRRQLAQGKGRGQEVEEEEEAGEEEEDEEEEMEEEEDDEDEEDEEESEEEAETRRQAAADAFLAFVHKGADHAVSLAIDSIIQLQAVGMVSPVLPRHVERLLPFSWARTAPLGFLVEQAVALLVWDRGSLDAAEREVLQARDEEQAQARAQVHRGRRGGGLQGLEEEMEEEREEREDDLARGIEGQEEEEDSSEEDSSEEESVAGVRVGDGKGGGVRRRVRFAEGTAEGGSGAGTGKGGMPRGDSIEDSPTSDSNRSDGPVLTGSGRDLSIEFGSWFGFTTAKPSASQPPGGSSSSSNTRAAAGAGPGVGGPAVGRSLKPSFHRAASWKLGPSVSFWKERQKGQGGAREQEGEDLGAGWLAPFAKGQAVGSRTQLQKAVRLAREKELKIDIAEQTVTAIDLSQIDKNIIIIKRLLQPIDVVSAVVTDTLSWKKPAITISSALISLYIVNGGLVWTLAPTVLVVYALVLLGLVPNTILPSSLMPHGQAVAEAAAAHAAARAATGIALGAGASASASADPSARASGGAGDSAPLLGPADPSGAAPDAAPGSSATLGLTSWLGALDPWGTGASPSLDGGTWAGVLDGPSQCLAAGAGQEAAVKMAVAGLNLGVVQVERAPSMNLDTIREIKATVDSITALLANVCIFLLKCRTILNGEYPDANATVAAVALGVAVVLVVVALVGPLIPFRVVATLGILHAYSAGMQFHALEAQRTGPLSKSLPVRIRRWWATVPVAPLQWVEPGALKKQSGAPSATAAAGARTPTPKGGGAPAVSGSGTPSAAWGSSPRGNGAAGSGRGDWTLWGGGSGSGTPRGQAAGTPPPRSASSVAREAGESRRREEAQASLIWSAF